MKYTNFTHEWDILNIITTMNDLKFYVEQIVKKSDEFKGGQKPEFR